MSSVFPRFHGGVVLFLATLALVNVLPSCAFQQQVLRTTNIHVVTGSRATFVSRMSSIEDVNKDDEIAKLEEQLRKLKEEKATEETAPVETTTSTVATDDDEMLEEASMDMFLSEGWKEARSGYDPSNTATKIRQDEERGSLMGTVGTVLGGILALVLFSQIPVGQEDLSKYSSIKSGPATSTIDLGDINRVKGQQSYGSDL